MRRVFLMLALLGLTLGGCGVDWLPESVPTTSAGATVTAFSFTPVTGVALNSLQTSNSITVTLISGTSAKISVTGGKYSIDNGVTFISTDGTVKSGDKVAVQHTAGSVAGQTVTTTLTIGDKSAGFSSTTASSTTVTPLAITPAVSFNVTPLLKRTSDTVVISIAGSSAAISVKGGTYSINGSAFTDQPGTVKNGDLVLVQHVAADGTTNTTVTTTLTVDGKDATFTSTTAKVVAETVEVSDLQPDTLAYGQVTLHLVPGTYTIHIATGANLGAAYSLAGSLVTADPVISDETITLSDGQVLFLQAPAPSTLNNVLTSVFTVGGVPITFIVHTAAQ